MQNLLSGLLFLLSHVRILEKYKTNSRYKQEHDSEDSKGDAVKKDSTKANSLFHYLLNISAKSQTLRLYNVFQF